MWEQFFSAVFEINFVASPFFSFLFTNIKCHLSLTNAFHTFHQQNSVRKEKIIEFYGKKKTVGKRIKCIQSWILWSYSWYLFILEKELLPASVKNKDIIIQDKLLLQLKKFVQTNILIFFFFFNYTFCCVNKRLETDSTYLSGDNLRN